MIFASENYLLNCDPAWWQVILANNSNCRQNPFLNALKPKDAGDNHYCSKLFELVCGEFMLEYCPSMFVMCGSMSIYFCLKALHIILQADPRCLISA